MYSIDVFPIGTREVYIDFPTRYVCLPKAVDSRCELRRTDRGSLCGRNSFSSVGGRMISEVTLG